MGLAWQVAEPEALMDNTYAVAHELAANPIPSLVASKELLLASGHTTETRAAHDREQAAFADLLGAPANAEALRAFQEKREPDFGNIPGL